MPLHSTRLEGMRNILPYDGDSNESLSSISTLSTILIDAGQVTNNDDWISLRMYTE